MSTATVPVKPRQGVAPERIAPFAVALGDCRTLSDVLAWLRAQSPRRTVAEIVTQDEYTHDVLAEWDAETWLAFDTT